MIQPFIARKPWIFRSIDLTRYKRGRKNSIEFLVLSVSRDERNHFCVVTLSIRRLSYKLLTARVGVYVREMLERRGFKAKDGIATEVLQWFRQKPLYMPQSIDSRIFGIFLVLKHTKIRWLYLVTKICNIFKRIIKNNKRLLKLYPEVSGIWIFFYLRLLFIRQKRPCPPGSCGLWIERHVLLIFTFTL